MAGTRTITAEPPRSTAYYYADLERLKRKNLPNGGDNPIVDEPNRNPNELSEYVESNEVVNDGPVTEVPPLRDRGKGLSDLPRPIDSHKLEETYSTAGTFPMPEPKEKEPLLAELELVGRLPLTQLDSGSGVRRSRSWYLCCPNMGEEEISRESSWRYSSLRPVTAPPAPGQNGLYLGASQSSGQVGDITTLRTERDALARALAAERQRAANAARAHDARLAELHGVIAELVRRRAQDKHARAIPEEEVSDECESTTQPAGELDNDADRSRTEQNDSSSMLSPAELPSPQEPKPELHELPDDSTDTSTQEINIRVDKPHVEMSSPLPTDPGDTSLNLSERDSEICVSTARCCQYARAAHLASDSCERPEALLPPSPGRCESRQAKLASRVRLRRTEETDSNNHLSNDETWCVEAAERLALDVCAQAELREALVCAGNDGEALSAHAAEWRARCLRLQADCRVLDCALARALDTAHRLSCACAVQESSSVALCSALRAADRALETYDVLLALAETQPRGQLTQPSPEREAAELVAKRLLARLEAAPTLGEPLLSPGPWLPSNQNELDEQDNLDDEEWTEEHESRLRSHAARLKGDTVALRELRPPPQLFSYHDVEEESISKTVGNVSMAEMEAAVMMQEVLSARELRAAERAARLRARPGVIQTDSCRSRRRKDRERHWLDASETDL